MSSLRVRAPHPVHPARLTPASPPMAMRRVESTLVFPRFLPFYGHLFIFPPSRFVSRLTMTNTAFHSFPHHSERHQVSSRKEANKSQHQKRSVLEDVTNTVPPEDRGDAQKRIRGDATSSRGTLVDIGDGSFKRDATVDRRGHATWMVRTNTTSSKSNLSMAPTLPFQQNTPLSLSFMNFFLPRAASPRRHVPLTEQPLSLSLKFSNVSLADSPLTLSSRLPPHRHRRHHPFSLSSPPSSSSSLLPGHRRAPRPRPSDVRAIRE